MKFTLFGLVTLSLATTGVLASQCSCSDRDTQCWAKCVTDTNSCITSCKGEISCYQNCINQGWPGIVASSSVAVNPSSPAVSSTVSAESTPTVSSSPIVIATSSAFSSEAIPSSAVVAETSSAVPTSLAPVSTAHPISSMINNIQSSLSQILSTALPAQTSSINSALPSSANQSVSSANPSAISSSMVPSSAISESASDAAATSATSTPEPSTDSSAINHIPATTITTLVAISLAFLCA